LSNALEKTRTIIFVNEPGASGFVPALGTFFNNTAI
jgi:hypothetical protein